MRWILHIIVRKWSPGFALTFLGCSPSPACAPAELARVEAACLADIARACTGKPSPDEGGDAELAIIAVCPEAAPIFERCEAARQKWVRCDG